MDERIGSALALAAIVATAAIVAAIDGCTSAGDAAPALATPAATATPSATPSADAQRMCDDRPENRQFDFWLGRWNVTSDGQKVAESTIERFPGSCAILERYSQPDGYTGSSINFYDGALNRWRQTWVDHVGTVSEFSGGTRDGAMELEGETHSRNGRTLLRKMRVQALDANRVRQYSERSVDGGKTWGVAYDFIYVRR